MADFSDSTYNLLLTEDKLTSQYAQQPSAARRLINLIPSRAGDLKRKAPAVNFATGNPTIGGQPAWYSYAQDHLFYVSGSPTRQFIIGVSNNLGTYLYKFTSGGSLTALPDGAYDPPHNAGNGWIGDPLILYSAGLLYISDGTGNWSVYDGTNTWKGGLDRPPNPPLFVEDAAGSIDFEIFREYAFTEYDSVRKHESPPSPRLRYVPDAPGSFDVTIQIPGRYNNPPGTASDWTAGYPDKVRIYCSHIDGSGAMFRVAEIDSDPGAQNWIDTNPFWGDSISSAMVPLGPPYRNHKPKPSLVGEKFYTRFALRDEARRSRIWVTGAFEVKEQDIASVQPLETVPGIRNDEIAAIEDQSDYENFIELPDESFEVRGMKWFEEGLMVGTERNITFIWGSGPEDFRAANTSSYSFGIFSRNGFLKTTHGLVIFTSDRKLVLDRFAGAGAADKGFEDVEDLGWPQQPELDKSDIRFTNRFQMKHFQFGRERDWLVVAYTTQNAIDGGSAHVIVYDFNLGGWITFNDVEATCVGILQENEGYQFLVAGNSNADRALKVLSDYNASATSAYQAAATRVGLPSPGTPNYPACTFRTALLDLGRPDMKKVWRFISFYKTTGLAVTLKAWFDPVDIEDLDPGDAVTLTAEQLGSNEWRKYIWTHHKRVIFEFAIPADANAGSLAGLEINAELTTNIHP